MAVLKTLTAMLLALAFFVGVPSVIAADDYYTEPQVFRSRPAVSKEKYFGQVGATGLDVRVYEGVKVTVEGTVAGSPAAGKFKPGEVITGINGVTLKGKNPYVVLGTALTRAEASDGKMVFDVQAGGGRQAKQVTVAIPVLGSYDKTWPLNCRKSQTIIRQAAEFYASDEEFAKKHFKGRGIPSALACLFLLSTGDDKYIPRVKAYFDGFPEDVNRIGDHTWNNGYNGIACAEYYLRTGDKSVLPILQYYCDDAKERQFFGVGWGHWGRSINPGYVAGGLMNPAGAQVVTTLLLAKECGVNVDTGTLLRSLQFWYRFTGHGTVPYGNHRGEGGLGSNGKDGMSAAIMQVASGAQGNVDIYKWSRNYLSMSMLTSYPVLVQGHGDAGRGDGIWRGIASAYMLDVKPDDYHTAMARLQWWYDLSRRSSGGLAMATCDRFDDVGSGAGVALAYTAPLKTLRITGAPRSKHAVSFKLPEHLWGRQADLAFLSIKHGRSYRTYGEDEPVHIPFFTFGSAYSKAVDDLETIPRDQILKNVYHRRYMIRAQAAKALRRVGAFGELEKLLRDADPRVRRAALDGLTDYRYWFAMGKEPIKPEDLSPAMLAAITKMLADPNEAIYVVDGALMALSRAAPRDIAARLELILPWTTHSEWWLRQSSFLALAGAAEDASLLPKVLPTMIKIFVNEYPTQSRAGMNRQLSSLLKTHKPESSIGKEILLGYRHAASDGEIKAGVRAREGAYNVLESVLASLKQNPAGALDIAWIVRGRFEQLDAEQISKIVPELLKSLARMESPQKDMLTDLLFNDYRQELIRRMQAGTGKVSLDTILSLTTLRNPDFGWHALGGTEPADRVWRFTSFDPQPKDVRHPREKKRFRSVTLPPELEGWHKPAFDDSNWQSGKAPIGKGVFKRGRTKFENQSAWGEGELLVARTTFEVNALDYDFYRIRVLTNQGFHIYLNGHKVETYGWWRDDPHYRAIDMNAGKVKRLKEGSNVLAVYANTAYPKGVEVAQIDVYVEGLRKAELLAGPEATADAR